MEISPMGELTELGTEDPIFTNQWHMNSLDELRMIPLGAACEENLQHFHYQPYFNLKTSSHNSHNAIIDRPMKQLKPNSWSSCKLSDHVSNPQVASLSNFVSFVNSNYTNQMGLAMPKEEAPVCSKSIDYLPYDISVSLGNQNSLVKANHHGTNRISTNTRVSQTQDHINAERKRRQKLSQRFITLSAMLPGLKKMDKASVLGDSIKYIKQLQEKEKTLEEQIRLKSMESVVFVKKSQLIDNNSSVSFEETLPEIEARFCDNSVLIRVHCEKRKGVVEKINAEVEKLQLKMINSSVVTFNSCVLDVTIIAQMEVEFYLSVKDLVKNLRSAFDLFM